MAPRLGATLPLLIALLRLGHCQDESEFFYGPVERNFAQVQPHLFSNTRQQAYFEHQDFSSQQKYSPTSQTGLPSPNYNQNPSPFQLPTGRSQPPGQFYLNQADYSSGQKSRFRQALPQNFQYSHPASTYRPDTSHIHSLAYQHDPSRPETFLGQITINNPDTDFLPSNRFQSPQFDGNSLRNSNIKTISHGDDADRSNDDLFRDHRVTTYNPARLNSKQRQGPKIAQTVQSTEEPFNYESSFEANSKPKTFPARIVSKNNDFNPTTLRIPYNGQNKLKQFPNPASTTEYKSLYDIGPLLQDDLEDTPYKGFYKPNSKVSSDVKVIKSTYSFDDSDVNKYDSNPSASSMNSGNVSKEADAQNPHSTTSLTSSTTIIKEETHDHDIHEYDSGDEDKFFDTTPITHDKKIQTIKPGNHDAVVNNTDDVEYEYEEYGPEEIDEQIHNKEELENTEPSYTQETHDAETENHNSHEEAKLHSGQIESNESVSTETETHKNFEVVTLNPDNTMVKDDNFKGFVDTTSMDHVYSGETPEDITQPPSQEDYSTVDTSTILRQEVVSVVTTKSVVNGTISIPDVTLPPISTKKLEETNQKLSGSSQKPSTTNKYAPSTPSTTTENWVIASVQTSRSVSGARFLPFPTVEQEEKKQVLTEENTSDDEFTVTENPRNAADKLLNNTSTESINDKLDSIQSELSSSVLSGSYKNNANNFTVITESSTENEPTISPTPLQLFTVRSITTSSTTEKSAPEPLPVTIKKFGSQTRPSSTTTTEKPKRKPSYVTVKVDDLSGFLPAGYKPRVSYKDRKKTSTVTVSTSTTPITTPSTPASIETYINETQGRSSGITNKNKVIIQDDSTSALPKDFKPTKDKPTQLEDIFSNFKSEDISKFLPPGFKLNATTTTTVAPKKDEPSLVGILDKVTPVDVSQFLPKDYQKIVTSTTKRPKTHKFTTIADKVDISAFLPKGFKLDQSKDSEKDIVKKVEITDLSNLLPPGYNASKPETEEKQPVVQKDASSPTETESTSKPSNGFKVVFPSRPGNNKPARKSTTSKPVGGVGPVTLTPTIHKGWPTRASTEFTGWPTPSTTPFSIDKLLEAQRNATATSAAPQLSTEATTRRTTTTTSTQPPPPPTTPGICRHECDIAGTIKIVGGVEWVPELLDHHTEEWKKLAEDIKNELNSVYSKSDKLKKWYKGIRIDAFSKGSVLVDYFVELHDIGEKIDTAELKQLFHKTLNEAKAGSVVEEIVLSKEEEPFDPDVMVGDQPEEDRVKVTKTVDKSAGKLEVGKFVVDPAFTEFIVLPKRLEPAVSRAEEDAFLPQWGIAVIVIALASLLFVIIFGVTVLVNRQKSAKAKQPIPLSEDMLRELDKSHMGGYDDLHLKERELPYPPSKQRRLSATLVEGAAYPGAAGDSWRSEWTPQLQQYMHHYTPDSGRGSQIYGPGGHPYGYGGGSQLYGQTGGGGSLYGYSGDFPPHPRSHYSRRRSEYDANF